MPSGVYERKSTQKYQALYDALGAYEDGDQFTSEELCEVAELKWKDARKMVSNFLLGRRLAKQVERVGEKGNWTIYRKVREARQPVPAVAAASVDAHEMRPVRASTDAKVPAARLVDAPLDYVTVGRAIIKIVEDQAGRITELKGEVEELRRQLRECDLEVARANEMVAELQGRLNEVNEKLMGKAKRPMTLDDLARLREGLEPQKGE